MTLDFTSFKKVLGSGEIDKQLRTPAGLAKDSCLVPSTCIMAHNLM